MWQTSESPCKRLTRKNKSWCKHHVHKMRMFALATHRRRKLGGVRSARHYGEQSATAYPWHARHLQNEAEEKFIPCRMSSLGRIEYAGLRWFLAVTSSAADSYFPQPLHPARSQSPTDYGHVLESWRSLSVALNMCLGVCVRNSWTWTTFGRSLGKCLLLL